MPPNTTERRIKWHSIPPFAPSSPAPAPSSPTPAEIVEAEMEPAPIASSPMLLPLAAARVFGQRPHAPPFDLAAALAALPPEARASLEDLEQRSRRYEQAATALNTRTTYRSRWSAFCKWCEEYGLQALPAHPEVVRLFALELERRGNAISTIEVSLAAIGMAHALSKEPRPRSERLTAAIKGMKGTLAEKKRPTRALPVEEIRAIVAKIGDDIRDKRDKAIILATFYGALRRSETAGLRLPDDCDRRPDGYLLRIAKSKTDQEGHGRHVGLPVLEGDPLCPAAALDAWIAVRGSAPGPLFVSVHPHRRDPIGTVHEGRRKHGALRGADVYRILVTRAAAAGFTVAVRAHGLRAGLATAAAADGAGIHELMELLGHSSPKSTLVYVKRGKALAENSPARRVR